MKKLVLTLIIYGFILVHADYYDNRCSTVFDFNGTIEDYRKHTPRFWSSDENYYSSCWEIPIRNDKFVRLKLQDLSFVSGEDCNFNFLKITTSQDDYKFCRNGITPIIITAFNDVEIRFHIHATHEALFKIEYDIQDIKCTRTDSFHCTSHSCIPKSQVCDDNEDCENGEDEIGCVSGINSVEGVADAKRKAIHHLRRIRIPLKGWKENTLRAITALYLSENSNFNAKNQEELMSKQVELETTVMLLKSSISSEILSTHINALLLTCQDPRSFYGRNLLNTLKDQLKESGNFTHPAVYLALCNAKEEWPLRATSDLINVLNSDSEYSFVRDFQAFAVMAIACYNESNFLNKTENSELISQYMRTIKKFKENQLPDGSFGNVHATSLITQSLLSSGQEHIKDWELNATIKYLMKELNSNKTDFLTYYLTLPILNGKSLTDVAKFNCSLSTSGELESKVQYHIGLKMQVKYSLFVGDEKDIIHTIYLKVPETFSAFEIMQYAQEKDAKYKFEWKNVNDKIDVYSIAEIANDSEIGKFWLIFYGTENEDLTHFTKSPDELKLKGNNHLVLWYKSANI